MTVKITIGHDEPASAKGLRILRREGDRHTVRVLRPGERAEFTLGEGIHLLVREQNFMPAVEETAPTGAPQSLEPVGIESDAELGAPDSAA